MGGSLVGREVELQRIAEAAEAAAGGACRCVLVMGEAGIGKTRLVEESVAVLDDALVLTGHGADMSTGEIPFGVLADSLRDLVRTLGLATLTPTEQQALAPLLPGAAPTLPVERVHLLSAFLDLLERITSQVFVVWVVEDLHWADSATKDLVNLAVRTLPGPLLVLATVRTDDPSRSPLAETALASYVAGLVRTPGCEVVAVSRLDRDEVRRQLRGLLGLRPAAALTSRIEELSDGIPFVVEELAAAAGRPELSTAAAVATGRLAGLSPDARRLVDAAAVGDGHLRISLLEQVVEATPGELDTMLGEATRAGILASDADADAVSFRHALLREATDRSMGPGARRAWHRRWAEVLEVSVGVLAADPAAVAISEHWHLARDVERAVQAAVAALPSAERIGDPPLLVRLWCRVLEAWSDLSYPETLTGLTLRQTVAQALIASMGTPSDNLVVLDAVPEHLLEDSERAVLAVFSAGQHEAKGGEDGRTDKMVQELFERFDLFSGPRDLFTLVALALAQRLPETDARSAAAVDFAAGISSALGSLVGQIVVVQLRSGSMFASDPQGAGDLLERELISLRDQPSQLVLFLEGDLTWSRSVCGEHREAQQVGEAALARLRHPELSIALWEHLIENHTSSLLCTGAWDRARELLEESAPWWEDDLRTSNVRLDLLNLAQRGVADAGRWTSLIGEETPGGAHPLLVRHVAAATHAADGDLAMARTIYRGIWAEPAGPSADQFLWCVLRDAARAEADTAMAYPTRSDPEAELHMRELVIRAAQCRRFGMLGEVWPLDLTAQVDRFNGRDPRPALEAALAGWDRIGHVPDAAITHLSLAEAHALHGKREAARVHLAAGRNIADELQAMPMMTRADALIDRFFLKDRDRHPDDVLTDREVEVLRLLAQGRTNTEIAGALFISPKTASVHVSHIIAKMGATNRTEAAALARNRGLVS